MDPRDRFASMDELATQLEACRSPRQPTSRRWIVAAVLALALVGGLAWWGRGSIDADDAIVQHETQPGDAVEQVPVVERDDADTRAKPLHEPGPSSDTVPPSPESPSVSSPSPDQVAPSLTDEPPTTIHDAPPSTRGRSRPRSVEPPSDARVLADVRTAATRACAAQTGTTEVTVDFLVQADGRPALIRARPSGNARTVCVEKQLRAAKFRTGVDRRATLRVPFDA